MRPRDRSVRLDVGAHVNLTHPCLVLVRHSCTHAVIVAGPRFTSAVFQSFARPGGGIFLTSDLLKCDAYRANCASPGRPASKASQTLRSAETSDSHGTHRPIVAAHAKPH